MLCTCIGTPPCSYGADPSAFRRSIGLRSVATAAARSFYATPSAPAPRVPAGPRAVGKGESYAATARSAPTLNARPRKARGPANEPRRGRTLQWIGVAEAGRRARVALNPAYFRSDRAHGEPAIALVVPAPLAFRPQ